jgi:hypothetical protein
MVSPHAAAGEDAQQKQRVVKNTMIKPSWTDDKGLSSTFKVRWQKKHLTTNGTLLHVPATPLTWINP